jgi:hypothetical protein
MYAVGMPQVPSLFPTISSLSSDFLAAQSKLFVHFLRYTDNDPPSRVEELVTHAFFACRDLVCPLDFAGRANPLRHAFAVVCLGASGVAGTAFVRQFRAVEET